MKRRRPALPRLVLAAAAVLVFVAISFLVARWLNTDTVERGAIVEVLQAQARGDAAGMLRRVRCTDAACVAEVRGLARRLKAPGELKLVLLQSGTRFALSSRTKPARVVWITPRRLTTVQCVLVRRSIDLLAGSSVTLLRISPPIGREASCP